MSASRPGFTTDNSQHIAGVVDRPFGSSWPRKAGSAGRCGARPRVFKVGDWLPEQRLQEALQSLVQSGLAEALALTGAVAEGLLALAAALAAAEASGTHWADAEVHRLRGSLLGRLPSTDWSDIETCFRTALTLAREQGSRGFELRAAVALARLLSAQQRQAEARALLAPVYGWFTEGFDTPDLQEAKALLETLDA